MRRPRPFMHKKTAERPLLSGIPTDDAARTDYANTPSASIQKHPSERHTKYTVNHI